MCHIDNPDTLLILQPRREVLKGREIVHRLNKLQTLENIGDDQQIAGPDIPKVAGCNLGQRIVVFAILANTHLTVSKQKPNNPE